MKMTNLNSYLCRALHCALVLTGVLAFSGSSDLSRFNEIGHQMMCTCGCGQILLECNHVGCSSSDRMRNELMTALTRDDSDNLVKQAFVQKYGPIVLAAPSQTGFDRTAWIMPFAALVFGFTLLIHIIGVWKSRPIPATVKALRPLSSSELHQYREQARQETEI
jgi:cytochrome c-type biogenesis protein CcmH/NrfF